MSKVLSTEPVEFLNVESFIWKTEKTKELDGTILQNEIKLVNCSKEQLVKFYNHCETMLTNTDKDNPGRRVLLNIVKDQRIRCNVELLLRHLEKNNNITRFQFLHNIRAVLENNPHVNAKDLTIADVTGGCPEEFKDIPLSIVMDGTLDKLGKFNRQHITLAFILKQGIWFTTSELADLTEYDENNILKDRIEVVKERLALKSYVTIKPTPKGLSYTQMRACINLKSKKYSELTTEQLLILRNRILFSLEDLIHYHIKGWEERQNQIKIVLDFLENNKK